MSTSMGAAEWIYSALKANATLCAEIGGTVTPRIYQDVIPQAAALPAVVYQLINSLDQNALGARATTVQQWQVKAVTQGQTYGPLRVAADQIDASLHRVRGTATVAGIVCQCERVEELMYSEAAQGIEYRHAGGIYRIYAGGTA